MPGNSVSLFFIMKGSSAILFSVLSLVISNADAASILDFIHPCENMSPECLKNAIQDAIPGFVRGIPELGIQSLDPFEVDNLKMVLPGGVKVTVVHGSNYGFKDCTVNYARMLKGKLEFGVRCNLTVEGKYKSTGRLLVFPIDGDGDAIITSKNIDIAVSAKLGSMRGRDGQTYLRVKNFKTSHKFMGRVSYHMTNLIKNNPDISNAVVEFMNSNWRMVAEEFGDPIVDFAVKAVINNVKKLFSNVPLQQLVRGPAH